MPQEWYLGDEAGWLTVWSVFRDSLIKEQQLSDQPITSMSFTRDTATEIQVFLGSHLSTKMSVRAWPPALST